MEQEYDENNTANMSVNFSCRTYQEDGFVQDVT